MDQIRGPQRGISRGQCGSRRSGVRGVRAEQPIGAPGDVYIVEGRDYTTSGTVSVATYVSFTQIPSFNVFYWC
jgi:hypothetical protein